MFGVYLNNVKCNLLSQCVAYIFACSLITALSSWLEVTFQAHVHYTIDTLLHKLFDQCLSLDEDAP